MSNILQNKSKRFYLTNYSTRVNIVHVSRKLNLFDLIEGKKKCEELD